MGAIEKKIPSLQFIKKRTTMRFAIFGNTYQPKESVHLEVLFRLLEKHNAQLCICKKFYDFLVTELQLNIPSAELFEKDEFTADIAISIGGDGTFLRAANRVGKKNIPILGINTGRLGFLADISLNEMEETFDEIYNNHYKIEEHSVLQLKCDDENLMKSPFALNEIAILKRDNSSMISIHTSINDVPLATYQADGLIIATPTGSTAYSLSVGGPIIVSNSKTIAITPVAPHSLNIRPIVICDDWKVTLDVESRSHSFLVAIDGHSEPCKETTHLSIFRADYTVKVIKRFNHSFFNTLRNKMMWGADIR